MDKKTIKITIDLGEVCQDIVTDCNLISKQLGGDVDAEIKSDVKSPDGNETKSIVCRAVTEAIGEVKYLAQRYLLVGREEDTNTLERLGSEVTTTEGEGEDAETTTTVVYEKQVFTFSIPNFNIAVTDSLKSSIHKYIVDYTMWRFLQNQVNDKAGEYKTLANEEDRGNIITKLNARTNFHKANFV